MVTPVGGGDDLAGQCKGFVEQLPKMVGVQPEGAAAPVRSWEQRLDHVEPIPAPETVASGLRAPYSGAHALRALYDSQGYAVTVSDAEILEGERLLARLEGLWVEPSSAAVVAALRKLRESGVLSPSDRVVCTLTGGGFKELHVAEQIGVQAPVVDRQIEEVIATLATQAERLRA